MIECGSENSDLGGNLTSKMRNYSVMMIDKLEIIVKMLSMLRCYHRFIREDYYTNIV